MLTFDITYLHRFWRSCPKLFFSCRFHFTPALDLWSNVLTLGRGKVGFALLSLTRTLRTGMLIPYPDIVAATL